MTHFSIYPFAAHPAPLPSLGPAAPRPTAATAKPTRHRLTYLLLLGGSLALGQCQPKTATEQPAAGTTPPGSAQLETAQATPLPKFDVESPIMRQLALLPAAERNTDPKAMHRYQQLTRRFWLAQYYTEYLLKEAQKGQPNLPVFTYQLATTQGHWRVVRQGLAQAQGMPPTMADHLHRMQQTEQIQQAALSDLQADCASQRPLGLDAANGAAQPQVTKLLAPLLREPAPMHVRIR